MIRADRTHSSTKPKNNDLLILGFKNKRVDLIGSNKLFLSSQ